MTNIAYQGEIMLLGWGESHNNGRKVTFQLDEETPEHQFKQFTVKKGKTAGQRFAVVLVEIGDDEQVVDQIAVKRAENSDKSNDTGGQGVSTPSKTKGGELAKLAGQLCNLESFFDFIRPVYDRTLGGDGGGFGDLHPDEKMPTHKFCRHAVLTMCDIESRAELDHDPSAAEKFHRLIRLPYMEYLRRAGK
jgi:hypothetical protein